MKLTFQQIKTLLKRLLTWLAVLFGVLLIAAFVLVYFFEDRLIRLAIDEIN